MGYKNTYKDVSNYILAFGNDVEDCITNLRLQKLVYYAQAWYLANYCKPLFAADFQAWIHGPVIPDLYHEYKKYGPNPIPTKLTLKDTKKKFDDHDRIFLEEVVEVYMTFTAYNLERMTHQEDPWIETRGDLARNAACNRIIPQESMKDYYAKRLEEIEEEED